MKIHFLSIFIMVLITIPHQVFAVRVPGLYESEVPVEDQDLNSRRQAIQQAMGQVLVKLTGDRNAATRAALSPVIRTAENYMLQYRYEQAPANTDLQSGPRLIIKISFDESKLNDALRNLGIQVWGRERPSTLIWLAMEDENSRRILQPEEDPDKFYRIDQRARARGIVLINPLFDLQDNSSLRVSDIWGGFHFTVRTASQRYYPDLILTGKISSPLPGLWEGLWTAYLNDGERTYTTEGSYLESVLNEGVDGIADMISANFAQVSVAELGVTVLKVVDLLTLSQYAKVLNYLQTLSPVTRVEVTMVSKGNVEFKVTAHGGDQAVTQAINFGRILVPVSNNQKIYRLSQ